MEIKRRVYLDGELNGYSASALAHVGDAVYELIARTRVCENGRLTARGIHGGTVALVSAPAQARALRHIKPVLTDGERAVLARGRNANARPAPKGSSPADYRAATGLEALYGYLYLTGRMERANELFEMGMSDGAGGDA